MSLFSCQRACAGTGEPFCLTLSSWSPFWAAHTDIPLTYLPSYFPAALLCLFLVWSVLQLLRGFDAHGGLESIKTLSDLAPRQLSCCIYAQPSLCWGFGTESPFTLMYLRNGGILSWRRSFPFSRVLHSAGDGDRDQIVRIVLHGICSAASYHRAEWSVYGRFESSVLSFLGEITLMGHSNNKTKQMASVLSSGNDFVVTYYFDFVAVSQLRVALKFLLQEGEACLKVTLLSWDRPCLYILFQHISSDWPQRLPFLLCVFVGALLLLVCDLEQYQSSFPCGLYRLSSRWSVCSTLCLIQLISCTINPVKVSCPGHAQ